MTNTARTSISATEKGGPEKDTSFPHLDSLSEELADLNALAAHDGLLPAPALVHSHLSPMYGNDVFQPFFTDIFSSSANPRSLDDFPLPLPSLEEIPLQTGVLQPWFQELLTFPQKSFPQAESEQSLLLSDFFSCELKEADPKHYRKQIPSLVLARTNNEGHQYISFSMSLVRRCWFLHSVHNWHR
jgi:hypothetical protein